MPSQSAAHTTLVRSVIKAINVRPDAHARKLGGGKVRVEGKRGVRYVDLGPAGWPDILVVLAGGGTLFLEVKTGAGRVKPAQRATHAMLRSLGHCVEVARNMSDAMDYVADAARDGRAKR